MNPRSICALTARPLNGFVANPFWRFPQAERLASRDRIADHCADRSSATEQ